jgi:solute carrier family 39 (zinc transporter), member 7
MEKTLRVLGGDDDSSSHSHSHSHSQVSATATSVASSDKSGLKSRGSGKPNGATTHEKEEDYKPSNSPSKLSAYLNLFGDFVHNM